MCVCVWGGEGRRGGARAGVQASARGLYIREYALTRRIGVDDDTVALRVSDGLHLARAAVEVDRILEDARPEHARVDNFRHLRRIIVGDADALGLASIEDVYKS